MAKKSDDGVYRDGRRLITRKDVRAKTNLSDATLSRRIKEGVFPAPIRMGPRCDRWFEDVVDATIENIRDNPPPPGSWGNPASGTRAGTRRKEQARRAARITAERRAIDTAESR